MIYEVLYFLIIVFFATLTAVLLKRRTWRDMRKSGGLCRAKPGKRPRVHRQRDDPDHPDGAIALALVAVSDILRALTCRSLRGTSVLIVVGVALDTLQQIESHLLMRHYEGFVKKGRIRGRRA